MLSLLASQCDGVPHFARHTSTPRGLGFAQLCESLTVYSERKGKQSESRVQSQIALCSLSSLCPESEGPSADEALGAGIVCRCRVRRRVESAGKCPERLTMYRSHGERESLVGKNPAHQEVAM